MTIYAYLLIISEIICFTAFFVGYFLCYIAIAPALISKHTGKGLIESYVYEIIHAESTLNEIAKNTDDKAVHNTLLVMKVSKYSIVITVPLFIIFAFLA